MSQVSFADAEAVDELIRFDSGFPPFDPALSILKVLASLRIQVTHGTQITTGISVALRCLVRLFSCYLFAPVSLRFHGRLSAFQRHEDLVRVAKDSLCEIP